MNRTIHTRQAHMRNRGFIGMIIGLLFILACLVGLYYVLFYKMEYAAPATVAPSQSVVSSAVESAPEKRQTTYVGMVTSTFEEVSRISFEFTYPTDDFTVTSSNDGKNISMTETGTRGTTSPVHKLTISYEGGRGYTPEDYWINVAKKTCTGCVKADAPFSSGSATTTLTYGNNQKIVHIVQSPKAEWLFVFELQKPADAAVLALRTFSFR